MTDLRECVATTTSKREIKNVCLNFEGGYIAICSGRGKDNFAYARTKVEAQSQAALNYTRNSTLNIGIGLHSPSLL